ncbi:Xanthotoxin 5-hydroxylase CYP82C4-like protein [Drosera capensis]
MKRPKEEIDQVVGKTRKVEECDLRSLVYLEATTSVNRKLYYWRLQHPKTRMLVNIWKIQRDRQSYTDPNDFKPERFLTNREAAEFEAFRQNFQYLPFGSGRWSCPSTKLVLQMLNLTAAWLLHSFDISTPADNLVDMSIGRAIAFLRLFLFSFCLHRACLMSYMYANRIVIPPAILCD